MLKQREDGNSGSPYISIPIRKNTVPISSKSADGLKFPSCSRNIEDISSGFISGINNAF